MPVLPLEIFLMPEDLHGWQVFSVSGPERWWVFHTPPRRERALARHLVRDGMAFYLPLRKPSRLLNGRAVRSRVPMFPGYEFFRGTDDERRKALDARPAAGGMRVVNQDERAADLAGNHQRIQSGAPLSPEAQLQPRIPAQIRCGPFTGLRRSVAERRGPKTLNFIAETRLLRQGVSFEIHSSMIQPL